MNFQKIPPVELSDDLLDLSFRKAREKGKSKKLVGNWLQIIRKKETLKLDIVKDQLSSKLEKISSIFPDTTILPSFYIELIKLTLDYSKLLKSLASLSWARKKIHSLHREKISEIYHTKERQEIKNLSKQFYGRVSSILKQINSNLI